MTTTTMTMEQAIEDIQQRLTPPARTALLHVASQARHRQLALIDATTALAAKAPKHPFTAGEITDEWINGTLQQQAERARIDAESALLTQLAHEAQNQADNLTPRPDDLLAEYQKLLTSLLAEAKQLVVELDGVDNATKAIDTDRVPQWRRLVALADDYRTLRAAQIDLMPYDIRFAAAPSRGGEAHASDLYLKNLDDLWPHWRTPDKTPGQTLHVDGTRDRLEPWPTDPVQLLIWLVTSTAEPWMPTTNDLNKLWKARLTNTM